MTAAGWRLVRIALHGGVWHGRLTGTGGSEPPRLSASWGGRDIGMPELAPADDAEGGWHVSLTLPGEVMSDGVQTVLISDGEGRTLAREQVVCGAPADDDLRGELALLRAEFELLSAAFRRHMSRPED